MKRIKFFASILLMLCLSVVCCAQTKIDWKQIKNIPDTLEFKNVLLEHLLFKSAYQPVMESIHQGAIYYDNMLERLRVYEHGQWRDLSVSIASDSIGAPLTILGYLQASDIYASQSAYIRGGVNASGTSTFNYLKVNNALKVPTIASAALGVGSVYYDTSANKLKVLNSSNQWKVVSVDVDSALSTTSTNPVENKVITAKINQTDADLINGMAATLQASYNYSNGIATQAYNYADSTASASKNYADLQISILNSTISEKLASGTSDLYVKSIRTTNASVTNKLSVKYATFERGIAIPIDYSSQYITVAGDPNLVGLHYNSASDTISFSKNLHGGYQAYNLARADNTVSDVATGTNNTIAVTKNGVTTNIAVGGSAYSVPTGTVLPYFGHYYASDPIPEGFLLCDGSLVSKNSYPELFAVVGYCFDDHQSGEYFALPNLSGRFLMGRSSTDIHASTIGKYVEAGLPNITGEIQSGAFETSGGDSSSAIYTTSSYTGAEGGFQNYGMALDASRCNSIYGNSNTVQPPALVCNYIIKY